MKNKNKKFIKKIMDIKCGLIYSIITRYVVLFIQTKCWKLTLSQFAIVMCNSSTSSANSCFKALIMCYLLGH
jgi:hypothetical protein